MPAAREASAAESGLPPLSHPGRVLYPEDGVTKRELADYYVAVASRLLPQLAARPLSLVRATAGSRPFFQRHPRGSPGLSIAGIAVGGVRGDYLVCDAVAGLVSLAQLGAVELHTWGSSLPDPLRADRLTFDLDPDPALDWRSVADAALWVAGDFARAAAESMPACRPARFTAHPGAARRRGRIFVDYLRNAPGATAVAAWSPRQRPGVPVAMPLSWREVEQDADLRGAHFTLRQLGGARLPRDPWAEYARTTQALTAGARRSLSRRGSGHGP